MNHLKEDALQIINQSIQSVLPQEAVKKALQNKTFSGNVILIAIGKAAWTMAEAAYELCKDSIKNGVVVTKYHHSQGEIGNLKIIEAGHPLPDENSILAAETVLDAVKNLHKEDTVIFLISGGGSALFEKPLEGVSLEDMLQITEQLLHCGADIIEINTIRKHLSSVKGGRFADLCQPATIYSIVLSDVLGDHLDSIASGPAYPDSSTSKDALAFIEKYGIPVSPAVLHALQQETPKQISNCETVITGSVSQLCQAAANAAAALGYQPMILTSQLDCEAREAGRFLAAVAKNIQEQASPLKPPCAIICGGETIVHITGTGKGGRNQELALSAGDYIDGLQNTVIVAIGSDGTDGPTDAAGAMVDGNTKQLLLHHNIKIGDILKENNSYEALKRIEQLIFTGSTGTNVNDLYFILCQ